MGYYKSLDIEKMDEINRRLPILGLQTKQRLDSIGSYIAFLDPIGGRMQLEELLIKMFFSLESGDLETYRQLRDIAISVIREKNKEAYLH